MNTSEELEWVAGLMEGEACFDWDSSHGGKYLYPQWRLRMTDEDIVSRARDILKPQGKIRRVHSPAEIKTGRKATYQVGSSGQPAIRNMTDIAPWLSQRRLLKLTDLGVPVVEPKPRGIPWLAGIIEGEGSWKLNKGKYLALSVQMTDLDVMKSVGELLGKSPKLQHWTPKTNKPVYSITAHGHNARYAADCLLPYMGVRRTAKIREIQALRA